MTYKAAAGSGCYRPNISKRTVFDDVVDANEAAPLRRFTKEQLVDELLKRDGVKEINLQMACTLDFRGYDRCLVIKNER
jgi:hypothetical protein